MPCSVGSYGGLRKARNPTMFPSTSWSEATSGQKGHTFLKDGVSHLLDPPIEAGKLKGEGTV